LEEKTSYKFSKADQIAKWGGLRGRKPFDGHHAQVNHSGVKKKGIAAREPSARQHSFRSYVLLVRILKKQVDDKKAIEARVGLAKDMGKRDKLKKQREKKKCGDSVKCKNQGAKKFRKRIYAETEDHSPTVGLWRRVKKEGPRKSKEVGTRHERVLLLGWHQRARHERRRGH